MDRVGMEAVSQGGRGRWKRLIKRFSNRKFRRLWKIRGEYAPTKKKYAGWSD